MEDFCSILSRGDWAVEGSFHSVLSRQEVWRGQVITGLGVGPGGRGGGVGKENMGQSIISEKNINSLNTYMY